MRGLVGSSVADFAQLWRTPANYTPQARAKRHTTLIKTARDDSPSGAKKVAEPVSGSFW